ncbi:uncharacterized protein LOC132631124 [Lycium barbarum]|uniref:uncharacterized protein LOC132631124 n=1 Tax=Lycium barbarum TaxID=112863 RepID=UPI00293ECE24|nr:uncharacterized protein LOC132631124 [Lycium barbarum]
MEHEIWWQIKRGTTNVWYENWTKLGALLYVVPIDFPLNEDLQDVAELIEKGGWKDHLLSQYIPTDIGEHIRAEIHIEELEGNWDRPWWRPNSIGTFTVNSAWNILRQRKQEVAYFKHLWIKGVPFKISFFLWRLWKSILPTDDTLRRIRIPVVSRCYCCAIPKQKDIQHLFLTSQFASEVWNVFRQAAVPAMITWELWKRRNTIKHGGKVSLNKVVHERWYNCNIDGASKGNPRPSSYGFCVKDWQGNLIYAECKELGINSNVFAEARAMMKGLLYCVTQELHPLILETDSLLMKNVVDGVWEIPWCVITEMERIRKMKVEFNVIIQHVYIEGNTLAGFLINLAFDFASTQSFSSFAELPSTGRKILNLDKRQVPNLRIRNAKIAEHIGEP